MVQLASRQLRAAHNRSQILVARAFGKSHYREGVAVEVACLAQAVGALITSDGFLHLSGEHTVCLAAIVALASQSLLRCDNGRIV